MSQPSSPSMTLKIPVKSLVIGVVVIVVVLAVLFIPMIPIAESYNETEPFNREATYTVTSSSLSEQFELLGRGVYHRSTVVVKNTDSYGGTFKVTHLVYDVNGLLASRDTEGYIGAGLTSTFSTEYDTQWLQDVRGEYSVTAPTIIDQRVVKKTRTIYKSPIQMLFYG